jgi:2-polyprenyl-3-methyl-5-hydroxy-6-metoxy-1,4-benzoquinol methylase
VSGVDEASHYAFPHSAADEARRLELFEQRLDPLTIRRIEGLGIGSGASCLEIGGGRGSMTRWLAGRVGPEGRVTATDVEIGFLNEIDASNVEILQHDLRSETFPERSFDLVHARAVLMHIRTDRELLWRIVSWLKPGGWLLLEEPDFGMWQADADPVWAMHPKAVQKAFPNMSLSRGRFLLREIPQLGLVDVGADAEADIIVPGTPLAEMHTLSLKAVGPRQVASGALTREQATAIAQRPTQDDFLGCGFVHIGVWGRRPITK